MSTVATRTHTIELALAHANTLGRMLNGAFRVAITDLGAVEILANVNEAPADLPMTLGLERLAVRDHAGGGNVFRVWEGTTSSAFGSFGTHLSLVEPGRYLGHRFEVSTIDNGPECLHCQKFANWAKPDEACEVRDRKALADETIPADCDSAELT